MIVNYAVTGSDFWIGEYSASLVTTFDGDTGSATPSGGVITIEAGQSTQNSGSTVLFSGSGSTLTFDVTDANKNTVIGHGAGTTHVAFNTTGLGYNVLNAANGAGYCTAVGTYALADFTNGTAIDPVGQGSNVAIGANALQQLLTGAFNTCIGTSAGFAYVNAEANNICIGYNVQGTAAETNVIRLGNSTNATCFIQGINGNTVTSAKMVTINSSTGQLGTSAIPKGAFTWTDEAVSFNAAVQNGYFVTANSTGTMPAAPSQGDVIAFTVDNATAICTVQANTGQILRQGIAVSASAGTAASSKNGDSITFVYRASDTAWIASSVIGTWTFT